MARKESKRMAWTDLRDRSGVYVGRFAAQNGVLYVENANGSRKTGNADPLNEVNAAMARFILSEPFPAL